MNLSKCCFYKCCRRTDQRCHPHPEYSSRTTCGYCRNNADQIIYQSEKTLNEMGDKVTEAEKAPVKEAIEKLKTAQKGTDLAAIKAATEEVQKAFYAVSEKLYKNAAPQGEANAAPNAGAGQQAGGNDDGVVDADYEEVKDN